MARYPFLQLIVKSLFSLGFLILLGLLYWSFTLQEEHLIQIRSELGKIKYDLMENRESLETLRKDIESKESVQNVSAASEKPIAKQKNSSPHVDSAYPNLLARDPFFDNVLPKLLPPGFTPGGTFQAATYGKPDNLHPFSNWGDINSWISLCSLNLAKDHIGVYEKFAPSMALKIEERPIEGKDYPEFWVHLREGVFFEPLERRFFPKEINLSPHFLKRHPVTSADFKFFFDALMNPSNQEPGALALRTYLSDIDELRIIDPRTFVVRWKAHPVKTEDGKTVEKVKYIARSWTGALKPLPCFLYQYFADGTKIIEEDKDPDTYRKSTVFAQNFSRHFAKNIIPSCGAWIFDGMTDREIRFRRNPSFFEANAALADKRVIAFRNSPDSIWQDFKASKLDTYPLQPDQEVELKEFLNSEQYKRQEKEGLAIKMLTYLNRSYTWLGWNQENPLFKSKNVRKALTHAIDRKRIVDEYLSGNAVEIHGTFFVASLENDPSIKPWPFDPLRAKKLLREEGWEDIDGDGILEKTIDGKTVKFSFALSYFVKNPTTKAIVEFVSDSLKKIGIDCRLKGLDMADLSMTIDDKSFDALYLAWSFGMPPDDPRQLWHSSQAKLKGSSNVVAFQNSDADRIIDQLDYEYDPKERLKLYHQFDGIIHEEEPYTFLYTPIIKLLYRETLQNVFLPTDRKDLIPNANISEPVPSIFWLKQKTGG